MRENFSQFPVSLPQFFREKFSQFIEGYYSLSFLNLTCHRIYLPFLCENFSFFAARITASLRFTANFFLSSEETRPANYNLAYLHLYIHIVIYCRIKAMLNLYYLLWLLQFVFIISSYSPLLLDPHSSFFLNWEIISQEKRDFFTHFSVKESRSNREFLS